jgi:hypothetical protein
MKWVQPVDVCLTHIAPGHTAELFFASVGDTRTKLSLIHSYDIGFPFCNFLQATNVMLLFRDVRPHAHFQSCAKTREASVTVNSPGFSSTVTFSILSSFATITKRCVPEKYIFKVSLRETGGEQCVSAKCVLWREVHQDHRWRPSRVQATRQIERDRLR